MSVGSNNKKLLALIEKAAILISPDTESIIQANSTGLEMFGHLVAEGQRVNLSDAIRQGESFPADVGIKKNSDSIYICDINEDPTLPVFAVIKEDDNVLLVRDYKHFSTTPGKASIKAPFIDQQMQHGNHFSYLFDYLSNKRIYTSPENVVKMGFSDSVEVMPKDWLDLIHEADRELYINSLKAAIKDKRNHAISYRVRMNNGNYLQVNDYFGVAQVENQWPALVGSIVSNSLPVRKIQQFERQALVGKFVGGMVHDFKNLLTGIQHMIEWCEGEIDENSSIRQALSQTVSYTKQASSLMRSTLNYIGGKTQEDVEHVYLNELVESMKPLLKHVLTSAIKLKLEYEQDLPGICAQPMPLQDLILNLCLNARDAMSSKGDELRIRIYTDDKNPENGQNQSVCISIQDTGSGMSQAKLNTIFEAFYSTKEEGVGLGLWNVQRTVRSFDGVLNVSSEEDVGTEFTISFPVSTKTTSSGNVVVHETAIIEKNTESEKEQNSQTTILIIEDEPLVLAGFCRRLTSFGYNIIPAEDGDKAWQLFLKNKDNIDVILQDFIIPGKRGEELLTDFLKEKPEIPVIVMSAFPEKRDFVWIKEQGAYAIMPKPFEIKDLIELLEKAVAKEEIPQV